VSPPPGAGRLDAALLEERRAWREARRRVVFTNGCFDLLHAGHVTLLEQARGLGDVLVVGVNGDGSVRGLKGPGRPLVPEHERREVLLALEPVDRVVVFDEPTPAELIRALLPDVLVKGSDWGEQEIVGRDVVEAGGGRVVRIPLVPGRSTTGLLERIRHS
jgi:D-beta-D-heptose 7-phosphate kinase/D-beta-D-heptose 1-phosphate adenosyltransferase